MTDRTRDPEDGALEEADGRWRLRFVRRLPHPPETVWYALTEEEHLQEWFPTTIEGEREPGAPLKFVHRDAGELPPETGEMIAFEPPSVLEFTWGGPPDGEDGELEPEGEGCLLTVTTTYDRVGKSTRDAAGWHVCLDLLEVGLDREEASWDGRERWHRLSARYARRFGPDATTIGPPGGMEGYEWPPARVEELR